MRRSTPAWIALAALAATGCGLTDAYVAPRALAMAAGPVERSVIDATLFLVGDAGLAESAADPVLEALSTEARGAPADTLIVFLGDNVYWHGIPEEGDREPAEQRLLSQIEAARAGGARAVFVAGNHDHHANNPGRLDGIERQAALAADRDALFLPLPGDPGPVTLDVGARVRIAFVDTQFALNQEGPEDTTLADVARALSRLGDDAGGRHLVVAGHHPLATHGRHGGYFPIQDHLFIGLRSSGIHWVPLPGLASIHVLLRLWGISPQDLSNGRNQAFVSEVEAAFRESRPLLYAAGHEHALQVLEGPPDGDRFRVVSGAGSLERPDVVTYEDDTLYAAPGPGYARVDFLRDGRVRLEMVVVAEPPGETQRTSLWLIREPDQLE